MNGELAPNATPSARMEVALQQIEETGDWIARAANQDHLQIGRIPERLGRASVLLEDAYGLVKAAREELHKEAD